MELDRPHYRTTNSSSNSTNSELFICFASRLSSSSSMKISKSILSPGRARDPPVSLSTSLSRRLRSNGSMKGGQASPMFPAGGGGSGGKKRGCAFENPEPSSPKVTCIGQVRVKTKKKKKNKAKQTRSLSRRRSGGGEVSFRKVEQQGHDLLGNSEENVHGRGQRYPPSNSSTHFQQPGGGEHRNQRWVHLPVTICEALRTFGAEFSCLFPCRSSCFSTSEREKEEKLKNAAAEAGRRRGRLEGEEEGAENGGGESSCGAVFARWFVALQDCEGRQQGRQIELVVGGEEEEEDDDDEVEKNERASMRRSSRRHVFENIEIKEDDTIEVKGGQDEDEKEARLSICIPPKNALLLMRCRSDPMKMATLTNRFWESPAGPQHRHDDDDDGEDEEEGEEGEDPDDENDRDNHIRYTEVTNVTTEEVEANDLASERRVSTGYAEIDVNLGSGMQEDNAEFQNQKLGDMLLNGAEVEVEDEKSVHKFCSVEAPADREMAENRGEKSNMEMEKEEEEESSRTSHSSSSSSGNSEKLNLESDATEKETLESFASSVTTEIEWEKAEESTITEGKEASEEIINHEKEKTTHQNFDLQEDAENHQEEKEEEEAAAIVADAEDGHDEIRNSEVIPENQDKATKNSQEESSVTSSSSSSKVLPDCLLLMMCEPKLSMEVSKETWVCSTDFIRWLPERHAKKVNPTDEPLPKKEVVVNTDSSYPGNQATTENKNQKPKTRQMQQQHLLQPPRSSCSLPAAAAAASMATMIEQKLVNAVGYEPFVLTRCKSEPMRTAAAKLAPDSCFWNNRKLEPHRPATFGVGAAGVGF